MFNATSKLLVAASIAAALLTSCGEKDKDAASALLAQAQSQFENRAYSEALATLDSIDAKYPAQVDVRREAMHLRPKVIEGETLVQLASTDSIIAVLSISGDSLRNTLTFVPDSFEGYYTSSRIAKKTPANENGLYARMSADGVFSVVSSAKSGTGSTSVMLSSNGAEARTPEIAPDGERNDRSRGVEIITFMPVEADTLGHFALIHRGEPLTLSYPGGKGSLTLSTDQAEALAEVYTASRIVGGLHLAQLRKNMLQQKLDIARSQLARTYREHPADSVK